MNLLFQCPSLIVEYPWTWISRPTSAAAKVVWAAHDVVAGPAALYSGVANSVTGLREL
jgi:hypothetical protein